MPTPRGGSGRVTLAQVAALCRCSVSTVSAVLGNRPECWASEETRLRVRQAARALGYRPNLAARSLRGMATQTIGLITTGLNVEVTAAKVQAFEAAAREQGYITLISFNPNDAAEEDRLITHMCDRQVDGLVVYPSELGPHRQMRQLVDQSFPLVTIDGAGRLDFDCDDVSTDFYASGVMQVEHLVQLGRRRLCQVNSFPTCHSKDQLRTGARQAAADAGLDPILLANLEVPASAGSFLTDDLYEQVYQFLRRNRGEIDGIMTYDLLAAACLRAATVLGIRVPEDLAIIGSDDSPTAMNNVIPLSTIALPAREVGQSSLDLLLQRISNPAADRRRKILVKPQLVARASTVST